jgi:hypothetical protein
MNVTFPVADWLFGTSDLDRGLLGHLFNGYDSRHVRSGLPVTEMAADGHSHADTDGSGHAAEPASRA